MGKKQGVWLTRIFFLLTIFVLAGATAGGQVVFKHPQPGEIYKEYSRTMMGYGDWRVTDPNATNPGAISRLPNAVLYLYNLDLAHAVRAEAVIDEWGGHAGTNGKAIRFNGNSWLSIPNLQTTPPNPQNYLCQVDAVVDIPLGHLVSGTNSFEGTNTGQPGPYDFGWGQFGMNSIVVRVYYSGIDHPTGGITSPTAGSSFDDNPTITATASSGAGINRVDFIAYYNGLDTDGDGVFQDWHYYYHRTLTEDQVVIKGHVGTAWGAPYQAVWDTKLVPDQASGSVKLLARIRDNNGVWFVTNKVENLSLSRSSRSVKMYVPNDVPERFSVWAGRPYKSCNLPIPSGTNLGIATKATVVISTFDGIDGGIHPGEEHYTKINGYELPWYGDDHFYALDFISMPPSALKVGNNLVELWSTSTKTGFELNWPGLQVVIEYPEAPVPIQLSSFVARPLSSKQVRLDWTTLSETENYGFEIEKSTSSGGPYTKIADSFIKGQGTTIVPHTYSYTDDAATPGSWYYRLRQIDLDGAVTLSDPQHVDVLTSVSGGEVPVQAMLAQNYPNPFNPSTVIRYGLPAKAHVTLTVVNTLGQPVATLVNAEVGPGFHEVRFNAEGLAAGVYFYRITAGGFVQTNKLVLLR
jgi:hypothetical protein